MRSALKRWDNSEAALVDNDDYLWELIEFDNPSQEKETFKMLKMKQLLSLYLF